MDLRQRIESIQELLRKTGISGWLLYDFRGVNPIARSILGLSERPAGSRRWFYYVPTSGEPTKIVHAIETGALDGLPGSSEIYSNWRLLHQTLQTLLRSSPTIAMEYSPLANNPYVSRVDAGTIELIRSLGPDVVSSGDLAQRFESCLTADQWASHLRADRVTSSAFEVAWTFLAEQIMARGEVAESEVCDRILQHFHEHNMQTYSPPTVARQPHNRLPHYETGSGADTLIRRGDLVLIDLWCKEQADGAIYSDLTKMAFVGTEIPREYAEVFAIVARARDAGIDFVGRQFAEGRFPQGFEVDQVVREVIDKAGYGAAFLHRTGHSLGTEVHGNGAHLDDLEMHEDREILPSSLFTIEPGIYLETFGIRSEVDIFVDADLQVHVTGGPAQTEIQRIDC